METNEAAESKAFIEIIKEGSRIEEACLYSSKGHFVAAHIWTNFHLIIGIPMVILSVGAGSTFIKDFSLLAAIFSFIVAILSAIITFLNPNERASTHLNAGNSYDALLNDVRIFRTINCWQGDSEALLTEKLKHFSFQKNQLNQYSPQITWIAYQIAKRGINKGEGAYETDKEQLSMKISDRIPKIEEKESIDKPIDVKIKTYYN